MFLSYVSLTIGLLVVTTLIRFIIILLKSDRSISNDLPKRGFWNIILGRPINNLDDKRYHIGMIFNKKENRLEVTSRLNKDTFDKIFLKKPRKRK